MYYACKLKGSTTTAKVIELSPPSSTMSEAYVPTRYVSLETQGNYVGPPPPYRRNIPRYRSHHSSRGCGCGFLRCCCYCFSCCRCCICWLLILIFLFVAIVAAFYYFLKPHIPTYNIDNLDVTTFDIKNDSKLYSEIAIVVKAENPNEEIGLDYGENRISIIYSGDQLCSGQFPPFLQPGKNITKVNVVLKGHIDFDQEMQQDLMQHNKAGNIPLLITVKVPIRLVIHDLIHLGKFEVNVNCSLVIDHLQPNQKPKILKKEFTYGVNF